MCVRACVRACERASERACMRGCVGAWVRGCVYACQRACMHAYVRACVRSWVRGCAWVRGCVRVCRARDRAVRIRACACMCACVLKRACVRLRACELACVCVRVRRVCVRVCARVRVRWWWWGAPGNRRIFNPMQQHVALGMSPLSGTPLAFRVSAQFDGLAHLSVPTCPASPPAEGLRVRVEPGWVACPPTRPTGHILSTRADE